jgi:diguanylate cyclase (GGDEF)-like protein
VLLRGGQGPPTTNQDRHLARLVSVAELAFSQATHRRSLEAAATTDALTGLGNRTRLNELADSGYEFGAAIYIDLDGFKQVNDALGHPAGDHILRTAARRITAAVRADDISVRMGGDEFVILVAESDVTRVEAIARRLVEVLAEPFRVVGAPRAVTSVSASIGVCRRADAVDLRDGIARADEALRQAKAGGKNRWVMA